MSIQLFLDNIATRCLLVWLLSGVAFAFAQNQQQDDQYLLSEATYQALDDINKLIESERHNDAVSQLQKLASRVADNAYETAVVNQTLGYAYNGLRRYEQAAEAFIKAADSNALPADVSHQLHYYIAQLLTQSKDYARAIRYFERWRSQESDLSLEANKFAAGLYYSAKNNSKVIEHARAAIRQSERAEENLYQLLLATYFEMERFSQAAELLEQMLALFPENKDYWRQLVGAYQAANNDKKAVAANELAYAQGVLDAKEKVQLARMLLYMEAPFRAARLLERELANNGISRSAENLRLLADSYLLAREREAAAKTFGEVAAVSGNAEYYYRQGQILAELESWDAAIEALENATRKNDFSEQAEAHLLLGIAAYKQERYSLAKQALQKAREADRLREQAGYWLERLEREQAGNNDEAVQQATNPQRDKNT